MGLCQLSISDKILDFKLPSLWVGRRIRGKGGEGGGLVTDMQIRTELPLISCALNIARVQKLRVSILDFKLVNDLGFASLEYIDPAVCSKLLLRILSGMSSLHS